MNPLSIDDSLQEANRRLDVGESESAEKLLLEVLAANKDHQAALMLLSRTQQARGDYDSMLETAHRLASKAPGDLEILLRLAECKLHCSEVAQSLDMVREVEQAAGTDANILQKVGAFWVQCERHIDGLRVYEKVMRLFPDAPVAAYNTALSRLFIGDIEEAESLFERVLQLDPDHHYAWLNRSTLRRQTPDSNHVSALEHALSRLPENHEGRIPLHYAIAKELEDLGQFDISFRHLQSGASGRRRRLSYNVAVDEEAMQSVMSTFPVPITNNGGVGYDSAQPLLVVGLPRSGTTLVERILACHSQVASLGEVHTLPYALVHTVGPHRDRRELIERSACCDFTRLGERYVRGLTGFGESANHLVDKTPFNLLYLGVIRRALPNARVIHLRRDPMDSCYAMYKTLFHSGYLFSYSLQDVGRFTIAYYRLMEHWRTIMPGWFLDLDYEALVTDTETQVRKLLDFLGLPFEVACMSPHKLASPVATASASQVRQPIYRSSVQRWRSYERQLAPLARKLQAAGLPVK